MDVAYFMQKTNINGSHMLRKMDKAVDSDAAGLRGAYF